MINEYPIDVNFYIAVSPPVPALIYSRSTSCVCSHNQAANPDLLTAFPDAHRRGSCCHNAHAKVFERSFNLGTVLNPRSNVSKSQLTLYNESLKTRYLLADHPSLPLCSIMLEDKFSRILLRRKGRFTRYIRHSV